MTKIFAALAVIISIVIIFFSESLLSLCQEWFPIQQVRVEAPFIQVSKQSIEEKLRPYGADSFLFLDNNKVRRALLAMPWVKDVVVSKKWPKTLVVTIREHQPVARFNQKGLIDTDGTLFYPDKLPEYPLPKLLGKEGSEKQLLQQFKKMSSMLLSASLKLDSLEKVGSIMTLMINDKFKIVLNSKEAIKQLQRFIKVYPELVAQEERDLRQVDLRYKHGLAVQWI